MSVVLAFVLALTLIPITAVTVFAESYEVAFADVDTVSEIQSNIQGGIDSVAAGGTVIVTGEKTGAGTTITLNIPTGKTVK